MAASRTCLVLGDGDFAFSARLASTRRFSTVTASTIDSERDLESRYPETFPVHRQLILAQGGRCIYELDARRLGDTVPPYISLHGAFDSVCWHNPYTAVAEQGSHRALAARKAHKKLLRNFLACAPAVLRPGSAATLVLSINPSTRLIGADFLLPAASASGFRLHREYPFERGGREHEYILRYGDDRDRKKQNKTYTKRSIRTYEFFLDSKGTAEAPRERNESEEMDAGDVVVQTTKIKETKQEE